MKVVILCGGFGTRLRDVSEDLPKPMVPVGTRPILWHIMKYYSHWGYSDFVLALGYKANVIKEYFINYQPQMSDLTVTLGPKREVKYHGPVSEENWKVTLAETGLRAMTGARVKRIKKYIGKDKEFLLTYGDGLTDLPLKEMMKFHRAHGKILTVTGVRPPARFGEIDADENGQVQSFSEKPQASGGLISGGFFMCRREIFDYLDDSENLVFEQGPLQKLVTDGQMMVYRHQGFWHPMDTNRDYQLLNEMLEKEKAPWLVW